MGSLALAGIPIWAGFWSKDEILTDALAENPTVYVLLVVAAFFTAFYMGRQIWLVFFGEPRSHGAEQAKESPWTMTFPLTVLALLSLFGGLINLPSLHQFGHWLEYTLGELAHATVFNPVVAISSSALALLAIYFSWLLYGRQPLAEAKSPDPLAVRLGGIFAAWNAKYKVDEFYDWLVVHPYQRFAAFLADKVDWLFWHDWVHNSLFWRGFEGLARFLANPVDLGVIDGIANGLAATAKGLAKVFSFFQSGYVRNYALTVFFGVVLMLGYLVFFA
jgi:NADH-quinone oxidoreductase subunit L